jgi:hypothetical protein
MRPERSNSSVVYGQRLVLKIIFRRVEPNQSDLEIGIILPNALPSVMFLRLRRISVQANGDTNLWAYAGLRYQSKDVAVHVEALTEYYEEAQLRG